MSFSRHVPTRILKSTTTNHSSKREDGVRCAGASPVGGRRPIDRRLQVGQKIILDVLDKSKEDHVKYKLYTFMMKLIGTNIYRRHLA